MAVIHSFVYRCAAAAFFTLLATGCRVAVADDAAPAEVAVKLSEWNFESSTTTFTAGVPYRFRLQNAGAVEHEWAVVPAGATDESGLLLEVEEDELQPGATVSETLTFPEPGRYDFVCFVPGHLEAGMRYSVNVVAK